MTEQAATRRLKQVAVEFNIAVSTVVDFLNGKGIAIENKPTSKVTEEAYFELLQKFQPDKITRQKSDNLKLTPLIHREDREQLRRHEEALIHHAPKVEAPLPVAAPEPLIAKPEPEKEEKIEEAPRPAK